MLLQSQLRGAALVYISLLFSPIYLSFIKPVWSFSFILSSTAFNRFAIQSDANLLVQYKRVGGLQFLRN